MRFRQLDAQRFGALSGHRLDLDAPIVVIEGPNESGKSTFRSALETVLYGFEPSRRAQHPLAQASEQEGDLTLVADLAFEGRTGQVERVLQDRGKLRWADDDGKFQGRRSPNLALPFAADVDLTLFRSVYALSTDDLVALDERAREQAGELLLGERALPELRPVHEVRTKLQVEAAKLWRKDRRGKAEAREAQKRLEEARAARTAARDEEDELRAVRIERGKLQAELEELRERRAVLEQEREDAVFLRELAELERRRSVVGPLDLSPLEGAALISPTELATELEALERRAKEPRRRLAQPVQTLTDAVRLRLRHAARIEHALRQESRHQAECEALQRARQAWAGAAEELRLQWLGTLASEESAGAERDELELHDLERLPLEALRAAFRTWSEAWEAAHAKPPGRALEPWLIAGAAGGSVFSLACVLSPSLDARWSLGGTLAVLACFVALLRAVPARVPLPEEQREQLGKELRKLGVELGPHASPSGVQGWIEAIERVHAGLLRLAEQERTWRELEQTVEQRVDGWRALANELELTFSDHEEASQLLELMADELAYARLQESQALEDANERQRTGELLEELEGRRAKVSEHLEKVRSALARSIPEEASEERAWKELLERREEHSYLRARRRELEGDARFERLCGDPRLHPAADETPIWNPRRVEEREEELRHLREVIETKTHREGEIASELARDPGSRVARAQEEIQRWEAELLDLQRRRDRLLLLEQVLAEAERRFRGRHQPDVLRRASAYLETITAGRYVRLDALEEEGRLEVWPRGGGDPLPVQSPLSRGTLDQIHLCLRLGLLDHLDTGRTPLPWILDEVLVHWDAERRSALYPLLLQAAERRQVFLLTCHPELAEEASQALAAPRVELSRTSLAGTA